MRDALLIEVLAGLLVELLVELLIERNASNDG